MKNRDLNDAGTGKGRVRNSRENFVKKHLHQSDNYMLLRHSIYLQDCGKLFNESEKVEIKSQVIDRHNRYNRLGRHCLIY